MKTIEEMVDHAYKEGYAWMVIDSSTELLAFRDVSGSIRWKIHQPFESGRMIPITKTIARILANLAQRPI